jgi:phage gpG-like protein
MPDMSLMQFIGHLAMFDARLEEATHKGLERAAIIVEKEAKRLIGHDENPAAGPFPAWQELADSTKEEKERLGYFGVVSEYDSLLRTGEMRDSIEHKVEGHEAAVGSNDDKAVWQELGTDKIPPRSFLGAGAFRKEDAVHEVLGSAVVVALVGKDIEVLSSTGRSTRTQSINVPISGHED